MRSIAFRILGTCVLLACLGVAALPVAGQGTPGPFTQQVQRAINLLASGAVPFTSLSFGGTPITAAAVATRGTKLVTGIPDTSATLALTWTAPNAQVTSIITVSLAVALGAGGAIGAGECMRSIGFRLGITRTPGVNAVSGASSAFDDTGAVSVAGGATCTATRSLGSINGTVTAPNTQQLLVTISHGTGSSTNHTALLTYEIANFTANGVTVQ